MWIDGAEMGRRVSRPLNYAPGALCGSCKGSYVIWRQFSIRVDVSAAQYPEPWAGAKVASMCAGPGQRWSY